MIFLECVGSRACLSAITFVSPWVSVPKDFLFANTPPVTPPFVQEMFVLFSINVIPLSVKTYPPVFFEP